MVSVPLLYDRTFHTWWQTRRHLSPETIPDWTEATQLGQQARDLGYSVSQIARWHHAAVASVIPAESPTDTRQSLRLSQSFLETVLAAWEQPPTPPTAQHDSSLDEVYHFALKSSEYGIWDWNVRTDTAQLLAHDGQLLGKPAGQSPLENAYAWFMARVHPEDRQRAIQSTEAHLQQRIPYDIEFRMITATGEVIWVSSRGSAIWDDNGDPVRMVGFLLNITARKQAELALQNSEEKFRQIAENIPIVLFFVQSLESPNLSYINPAYETIWGKSCQELFENPLAWLDSVHPQDRPQVRATLRTLSEFQPVQHSYRIIRPDGEIRWVLNGAFPIANRHGQFTHIAGYCEDITDSYQRRLQLEPLVRHRTREVQHSQLTLHQRERELNTIVNNLPDAIARFDLQKRHQFVNAHFEFALGKPKTYFLGKTVEDLNLPAKISNNFHRQLQIAIDSGKNVEFPTRWQYVDGSIHIYRTRLIPEFTDRGEVKSVLEISSDITHLLKTEQMPIDRDRKLDLALEIANLGFWEFDPESDRLQLSERIQKFIQIDPEHAELTSTQLLAGLSPHYRRRLLYTFKRTNANRSPFKIEFQLQLPHRPTIWLQIQGRRLLPNGTSERFFGVAMDITERKQAELDRRQSELQFQALVANVPGTIYQYVVYPTSCEAEDRLDDAFLYLSPSCEEILEVQAKSVYQDSQILWQRIHPEDRADIRASIWQAQRQHQPWKSEFRLLYPSGEIRWVQGVSRPSYLANREVIWDGLFVDIHESRIAREKLAASQRFNERLADTSPNILYIYDIENQCNLYTNHKITDLLGYTPQEIYQMSDRLLLQLMHPEDFQNYQTHLAQLQAAGDRKIWEIEYRLRRSDGTWRWFSTREIAFKYNSEGKVLQILGTSQDITERKQAEAQIQASLEEKEVLLREIHHRVKNNLNVVHSLLKMQARRIQDNSVRETLLDSQRRLQAMALIHEKLYRSDSIARIDFAEYLRSLATSLAEATSIQEQQIQLEVNAQNHELDVEIAMPCGLIVNELLSNAFKHAFPTNVEFPSKNVILDFYTDPKHDFVLSIRDNGIGLPNSTPYQSSNSLGMRLVKILCDQLDAKLSCTALEGTTFRLVFSRNT